MGYQDRDYYRDSPGPRGPLQWLISGSVPLFTAFGIPVRAHASLIVLSALILVFGLGQGFTFQDRLISLLTIYVIITLHEFGHCFGSFVMGGKPEQILLTPLGGLAMAMSPRRPLAQFVTVAAGPLVNVLLLAGAGLVLYAIGDAPGWNPLHFSHPGSITWASRWAPALLYLRWFFQLNYLLLLFNLLPIFPMDGGQLLQAILWRPIGFYRSMMLALTVGLILAPVVGLLAIWAGSMLTFVVMVSNFITSYTMRAQIRSAGPYAMSEEDEDYSAASWKPAAVERSSASSRRSAARAQRNAEAEAAKQTAEQGRIDAILEKVHQHGMASLSYFEKRALRTATERQRDRKVRGIK